MAPVVNGKATKLWLGLNLIGAGVFSTKLSPWILVSSRRQADEPPKVVSDRFEREFQLVLHQSQVAHAPIALPLFEVGEHPLDQPPFETTACVAFMFLWREFAPVVAFFSIPLAMPCPTSQDRLWIVS